MERSSRWVRNKTAKHPHGYCFFGGGFEPMRIKAFQKSITAIEVDFDSLTFFGTAEWLMEPGSIGPSPLMR